MFSTKEQNLSVQKILKNNPSMVYDGKLGFYSNRQAIMTFFWIFDETKEEFKIKINPDGTIAAD